MNYYRVRIELEGPLGTPLHSGTLFGHLCWARRYLDGEEALARWLASLEEGEPFLISSGVPAGLLPRPLLAPVRGRVEEKQIRKRGFLPLSDFLALRNRLSAAALAEKLCDAPGGRFDRRLAHNTIDRRLGTTPEEGGLYFVDEFWPRGAPDGDACWDVYVGASLSAGELAELFDRVGRLGYGRDATIGRGRFRVAVEEASQGLFEASGRRRMSLSHGSLTRNMARPRYRLEPHFGKLGPVAAAQAGANPFKYPLVLLRPGATFEPAGVGPFGELLGGVHPAAGFVRHNAWHLAIPYDEPEEE